MPEETTRSFQIGDIQCIVVNDGTFSYPASWFFSNVPEERLEGELRLHGLQPDQVLSPYACLLIKAGNHKVLVDTGAANLAPTTGELLPRLQTEGLSPADIDTVVLTHGHPDHIGGTVDGEGKPAFPNARYVMWKDEWNFWTAEKIDLAGMNVPGEIKALLLDSARRALPPIKPQIDLLERETEIVPGVHAVSAPGHTPGHMALIISSGRSQLLVLADAVLHPMHLEHPDWQTVFDLAQDRAGETRRQLLDRAASDQAKVMAYHFPFPGLGQVVVRGERAWRWEPA
jgi:glyoxylase-like metal-dependent hydrolase (beta-lactamase superfamily II)